MLAARLAAMRKANSVAVAVDAGGSLLLFLLIIAAGFLTSRDFLTQQTESWLQAGQTGLSERMQGEQRLEHAWRERAGFLARYLDAQVGAIYLTEAGGVLRRFAGFADAARTGRPTCCARATASPGQAAKENRVMTRATKSRRLSPGRLDARARQAGDTC